MADSCKHVNGSEYFLPTSLHFCYFKVLMGQNNFQNDSESDPDHGMSLYTCSYWKSRDCCVILSPASVRA